MTICSSSLYNLQSQQVPIFLFESYGQLNIPSILSSLWSNRKPLTLNDIIFSPYFYPIFHKLSNNPSPARQNLIKLMVLVGFFEKWETTEYTLKECERHARFQL